MQSSYQLFFSVTVSHSYFENNLCKGIQFVPTSETKGLMQRYQLLMSTLEGKFELYGNTTQSVVDYLNYISDVSDVDALEFEIQTIDPNFYAFTDFPMDWIGKLLFSSDALISTEDTEGNDFYMEPSFSSSENVASRIVVTIRFEDLIKAVQDVIAVSYEITFKARQTQWQYYIINNGAKRFNELSIATMSDIKFNGPVQVTLPNNQEAQLFTSDRILSLQEIPEYKFKLVDKAENTSTNNPNPVQGKVIFNGLPNPNPSQMGVIEIDGKKQITSPMYIYV